MLGMGQRPSHKTGWLVHEEASCPILLGIHHGVAAMPIMDLAAVARRVCRRAVLLEEERIHRLVKAILVYFNEKYNF